MTKPHAFAWDGRGCEVSCGGHHRQRGETTTGSAMDGAVIDFTQILAYLVHNYEQIPIVLGPVCSILVDSLCSIAFDGFMVKL